MKEIGCSSAIRAKFRKNENVSLDTIAKICNHLHVPIEDVVDMKVQNSDQHIKENGPLKDLDVHCNLRKLRKAKGYTMIRLAELVGMNKGNLSKYEDNKVTMNVTTAAKFAIVLNCTLEELFTYEENNQV